MTNCFLIVFTIIALLHLYCLYIHTHTCIFLAYNTALSRLYFLYRAIICSHFNGPAIPCGCNNRISPAVE